MIWKRSWMAMMFAMMMLALVGGCSDDDDDDPVAGQPLSLTVLHVNDTHSHLEPSYGQSVAFDGVTTYLDMGGFARLATLTESIRAEGGNTLLLHAGDAVQGTLYYTRYNGEPEMRLMNMLGFDAMVLGNHEFDKGPGETATLFGLADFPIISANIDASADADLNGLITDYVIREFDGEKVGIVGLTLEDTTVISSPGANLVFNNAVETARTMVAELESEGINKIIFLTHMGYEADMALGQSVAGIDIIVGGHSHSLLGDFTALGMSSKGDYPTQVTGPEGDPVYVVQSWEWAKILGRLNVEFDAEGNVISVYGTPVLMVGDTFKQKDAEGNKVEVSAETKSEIMNMMAASPIMVVAEDPDVLAMMEPYTAGVEEFGNVKIGTASQDLLHIRVPGTHTSGVEMPNGSYIAPHVCEAMVWKANSVGLEADMALQNAGGVRIDILAGDITIGDAYTLMPFGNTLFVLDLTGAELKSAIQTGLTRGGGAFPYVGSARYTADATNPEAVTLVSMDIKQADGTWMPVADSGIYRIATNAYIAGGGDGYTVLGEADAYRYDTGFVDAETFVEYVEAMGTLDRPTDTGVTYMTAAPAETVTLKFIETTDVHGSLFPYDFIEATDVDNSLTQVYTYVKQERAKTDQQVILLDNGDILQGQPIVNYYNFERDTLDNHIIPDVMNYMGYDAAAVGNHDIEPGKPVYDAVNAQFNFPWLAANAIYVPTGEPYFTPYTVIEKGGVKIAVLGLITPGIPSWLPQSVWPDLEFEDMIVTAQKWVPIIQERENPDLLVGLFHAGFDYTYGGVDENTYRNQNASQLVAKQVPGFDIIFIGHDHMNRNETVPVDGSDAVVHVLGGKNAATSVATATVTLTRQEDGTWAKTIEGAFMDTTTFAVDADMYNTFTPQIDEVKAYVGDRIGTFTEATSSRDAMFGDSSFNDLIHELQFDVTEKHLGERAAVSFAAPLQFDKTIEAGPVYISDMYKLYKYENQLYLMELSGAEIDGHLEYSYAYWTNQMTSEDDHLLNFNEIDEATGNYDLAARYYNYDSAAGIVYEVDVTQPQFDRVTILGMDADLDGMVDEGGAFDMNAMYKVAINSYRGAGGGGHLTSENGANIDSDELENRKIAFTERDLRFYLTNEIREKGDVTPRAIGNWKFVPEDWAAKGAEKDRVVLYEGEGGEH